MVAGSNRSGGTCQQLGPECLPIGGGHTPGQDLITAQSDDGSQAEKHLIEEFHAEDWIETLDAEQVH